MQCLYKQKLLSERPHVPAAFIPVAYLRKQVVIPCGGSLANSLSKNHPLASLFSTTPPWILILLHVLCKDDAIYIQDKSTTWKRTKLIRNRHAIAFYIHCCLLVLQKFLPKKSLREKQNFKKRPTLFQRFLRGITKIRPQSSMEEGSLGPSVMSL